MKKFIAILLMLGMVLSTASCGSTTESQAVKTSSTTKTDDLENSENTELLASSTSKFNLNERKLVPRDYFVNPSNAETVTLLIYMCGSDLESNHGSATNDIAEILEADISDNVNVIMETGGANSWHKYDIGYENTRYQLTNHELVLIDDTVGNSDMGYPQTLSNFINYGVSNFPADRYMLVLWDHGGGVLGGYSVDERFDDYQKMTIDKIGEALSSSPVRFDFIGFDACLMSTLETAFVLEEYTDYLISSQLEEPSSGWYYTNWINALSSNPSISVPDLSKIIIDDFVSTCSDYSYYSKVALSLIDLTKLYPVMDALDVFIGALQNGLVDKDFATIAKARANLSIPYTSKNPVYTNLSSDSDHVDIATFAESLIYYYGAKELISATNDCIIYENHSVVVSDRHGLNIYFPYTNIEEFLQAFLLYNNIGFSDKYTEFLSSFVSIIIGGQKNFDAKELTNVDTTFAKNTQDWWSNTDWFDERLLDYYNAEFYSKDEYTYDTDELKIEEKNGTFVVKLSEDDHELTTNIQLSVLYDNKNGYTHLGFNNSYTLDNDGDLLVDFNNKWLALDGQIVPFFFEDIEKYDNGTWSAYGYVQAHINGNYAEIIVTWNNENPDGYVAGYRVEYDADVSQKGLFQLTPGDTINYIFDRYDYEFNYQDSSSLNNATIYYDGSDFKISYEDIDSDDYLIYYCLVDIYGNIYCTETYTLSK